MNGRRILIVEDNDDNQKLVGWLLEDAGYAFVTVPTAEHALERLEHDRFDLVLMDISLPGMDGKQATRTLRADARYETLPIIAVTAHAVPDEAQAIRESGVDLVITKPLDEEILLDAIRSRLEPVAETA